MEGIVVRTAAMAAALLLSAGAAAQATEPAAPPPSLPTAIEPATDAALILGTAETRMTVPVSIDKRGPWPFVIDTGAERTVVSRQLADTLGLAAGPAIRVTAMTGTSVVGSVIVPALGVSDLPRPKPQPPITAPALEDYNIGAAGILGIDTLQGHRVDIDFVAKAMDLKPSRRHFVAAGSHGDEIVVVARSKYGQLIVTDARWRGKRVAVIIDTGSSMTVGNPALATLMAHHARHLGATSALSVTGKTMAAEAFVVNDFTIGGVTLDNVPIAFADAAPFRRFGLAATPALMLGMDALRLFRRVRIDFANRAIEFLLPERSGVRTRFEPAV